MTGNGKHTTYKHGDDWGMVYGIVWPKLLVTKTLQNLQQILWPNDSPWPAASPTSAGPPFPHGQNNGLVGLWPPRRFKKETRRTKRLDVNHCHHLNLGLAKKVDSVIQPAKGWPHGDTRRISSLHPGSQVRKSWWFHSSIICDCGWFFFIIINPLVVVVVVVVVVDYIPSCGG